MGGGFGGLNAPKPASIPPAKHPEPPVGSPLLPPRQADPRLWWQEQGVFPTVFPQPADVRLDDTLLHEDREGGCEQTLRALSSSATGGYAAVWNDTRNGNLGLFLGLLDADGRRCSEDWPVNPPLTSRQFEPTLTQAGPRRGAVAWFSTSFGYNGVRLRFFSGAEGFLAQDMALGMLQPAVPAPRGGGRADAPAAGPGDARAGGGRDAAPAGAGREPAAGAAPAGGGRAPRAPLGAQALPSERQPGVVMNANGEGACAWADGANVWLQLFRSPDDGTGVPRQLNPDGPPASGAVQVAMSSGGTLLVAWTAGKEIALYARGAAQSQSGGAGALVKLSPDPRGGFWALVALADRWFLRHYSEAGAIDAEDLLPVNEPCVSADFALLQGGQAIAFLVEHPQRPQPLELHVLRPDGGAVATEPLRFPALVDDQPAPGVTSPRIAAHGTDVLVAWSDRRSGNLDVWSTLVRGGQSGPEQRMNQDGPSSYQLAGGISGNGTGAIAVWQDERWGPPRVLARRIEGDARLGAQELALDGPLGPGGARQTAPNVAMESGGGYLAAWWQSSDRGDHVRVRAFDARGEPLADSLALEIDQPGESLFTPAVAALPHGRGFAVMWIRKSGAPAFARLTLSGKLETPVVGIGTARAAQARNPFLCTLSDGRLIALWDTRDANAAIALRGTFLRADCVPEDRELAFATTPLGGDHDPCAVAIPAAVS